MSYILSKNVSNKGRENSPGGSVVYLAEYQNVVSVDVDDELTYVSGITMSGTTKFFKYEMPRENINFINQTEISIPNGVYIFKPLLSFNIPGLTPDSLKMFDVLVRKSVIAIVKTNEGKYFIIGKDNGLDLTSEGQFSLGLAGTDLIGSTISLEGLENTRIMEIDPTLAEGIMTSIVSSV